MQLTRTSICEVAIVLHGALLAVLEVLVLYLDQLHHLGVVDGLVKVVVKVVDKVPVRIGVGVVGFDVDVVWLA